MVDVKIKLLSSDAKMPVKANISDAAFDCFAHSMESYGEGDSSNIKYNLGFSMEIPIGWCALIFPRSSIFKTNLMLTNSVGVIDSGYRGEIAAIFKSKSATNNSQSDYKVGDRICQIIFYKLPDVNLIESNNLDTDNDRGGGFGSTGNDKN